MEELNVFDKLTAIATPAQLTMFGDSERSRAIAEHKAWLQSIRHERPNTEANYKIGIYIRYFKAITCSCNLPRFRGIFPLFASVKASVYT